MATLLTGSEWNVMECRWDQAPRTVTELAKELERRVGWAKSTTLTTVRRMEHKGLVRYEQQGRAKQYFPTIPREQAAMEQTRHFLQKVYQGSVGQMVSSLLEHKALSPQQIQELSRLLEQAEQEAGPHA